MIPTPAREFADRARALLGDNLLAVVLVGSYARDDERPDSDIDLFVLVADAGPAVLRDVGKLTCTIDSPNEINPAFVTVAELRQHPDWNDVLKIRHDGIALYGQLPPDIEPTETELTLAKRIAREVLMSSRHYLAVSEPAEAFMGGKLWTYNLKPLSFAARFYHFAKTGRYIRRLTELQREYPVLALDPANDHEAVIEGCVELCEAIMSA